MEHKNTFITQPRPDEPLPYHYLMDDLRTLDIRLDCEPGDPHLVLDGSDPLIGQVPQLAREGWLQYPLLAPAEFAELKTTITNYVYQALLKHQPVEGDFTLENYHTHLKEDSTHYAISSWALAPEIIGPAFGILRKKIEGLLGVALTTKQIDHRGQKGHFLGFRIVRPGKADHNPYHRDAWLAYWQDTVNVWLPIAGFEHGNTINLLPQTHRLNDSQILKTKKGAVINGNTYHVPAAIGLTADFPTVRPELQEGEGLVFSPYILHGNGVNRLANSTRVSIELRFCKLA